jgi:ubiquitin-activating enzyme E1
LTNPFVFSPFTSTGPDSFSIGDTTKFDPHLGGGIVTQVKQPQTMSFSTYSSLLSSPKIFTFDFAKFEEPLQLHLAFLALDYFKEQNGGSSPRPWNNVNHIFDEFLTIS